MTIQKSCTPQSTPAVAILLQEGITSKMHSNYDSLSWFLPTEINLDDSGFIELSTATNNAKLCVIALCLTCGFINYVPVDKLACMNHGKFLHYFLVRETHFKSLFHAMCMVNSDLDTRVIDKGQQFKKLIGTYICICIY